MGWFHWEEAFHAKTLYDPLLCSPIACDCACLNSCVVLGDVVVNLRQETKDYQGFKYAKCRWLRVALVTKGPEEPFRSRSFEWTTLSVPVHWVDTSFSCQEHGFSDKPRSRQVLMQSHMRHGFEDLQWIYHVLPVFAKFVMLETFGNVDILGLDIESSGLNSVILRLREVHAHISVFWSLNIFNNINNVFLWFSWPMSWKPKFVLLARTVCILVYTRVVSAMIRRNTRDRFRFPRIFH